ncbi:MAG: mechanosensitive ion channel [Candidatus Omnitrophica bacterium]|nr:mechanosensitive ion channel [Candidatus Omnitrophota bacterium]
MNTIIIFGMSIYPAVYIPALYFVFVGFFLIVKKSLYKYVEKIAAKTETKIDDIVLEAAEGPLLLLIFAGGIFILQKSFGLGSNTGLEKLVDISFKASAILAIIVFFDKALSGILDNMSSKLPLFANSSNVVRVVVRTLVIGLGVLVLIDSLGISIAPILASLGIGSLAVALAVQPTLENFFSGVQIIIDKPIGQGHFIKLDSGEEGYVQKIGWRSTWIKLPPNNMLVIPNKVLVNARVMNYQYPDPEMALLVDVGVDYNSDLAYVEKVTLEVAKMIMETIPGGVKNFDPVIRYTSFGDSSIIFSVILRAKAFSETGMLKHEFIKALHKRYREAGIVFPYPVRTLEWNPLSAPIKIAKQL